MMGPAVRNPEVIVLFPGQGAYYPGALSGVQGNYPQVAEIRAVVDDVAREMLGHPVFDARMIDPANDLGSLVTHSPVELQLAIYATSVAAYQILEANGLEPTTLIGHSLGEIAALVCAGAWTIRQGAQIVAHRSLALSEHAGDGFGMAALGLGPDDTAHIVALTGGDAVVAVENHARQTVVTGTEAALEKVGAVARGLRVSCTQLAAPFPFHSPWARKASDDFRRRLGDDFPAAPLALPVHSPIEGRAYTDGDDLPDLICRHLVRPLRFATTIDGLHRDDAVYIESGALGSLTRIVDTILGDRPHTAVPTLLPTPGELESLAAVLRRLRDLGVVPDTATDGETVATLHGALLPDVGSDDFARFWSDHAAELSTAVRTLFSSWSPSMTQASDNTAVRPAEAPAQTSDVAVVRPAESAAPPSAAPPSAAPPSAAPPSATEPSATEPSATSATASLSRAEVLDQVVGLYATALEYPPEVLEEDADLEGELGVDSVKQTELLSRVSETFGLPPRPADFRPADYSSIGRVADMVMKQLDAGPAATPASDPAVVQPAESAAPPSATAPLSRAEVLDQVVGLYATALEYPPEVLEEDADLEGELGVDSVKQTELLSRVSETFGLPPRPADFRPADYSSIGRVADMVMKQLDAGRSAVAQALESAR